MAEWHRSHALPRGVAASARIYLRPVGLVGGDAGAALIEAGAARPLAGGAPAFTHCEVLVRDGARIEAAVAPVAEAAAWAADRADAAAALERLAAPRAPLLDLPAGRPAIMGVINVTPDSFSDGGDFAAPDAAVAHGRALAAAGADILDVGGESTRPGSDPVAAEDELARAVPVVRALAADGAAVSVDSRRAAVMRAALDAGARMVNDVSALGHDPEAVAVAAGSGAAVVLMHAQGDPKTMQKNPVYDCAPLDIYDYLEARVAACEAAGIDRARIVVDPGVGFGKTLAHNLEVLHGLALFHGLGCRLALGVSRKSFIGRIAGVAEAKARVPGSLAAGLAGLDRGAQILRVHDVADTVQAVAVWRAIADARPSAIG